MIFRPPYLEINNKVALAAPSRKIKPEEISFATQILKSWGLHVCIDDRLFKESNQFGGTDEERLSLFQDLLDSQEVKAIFCVRGGYGITRIIDRLDFSIFKKYPKWICGYSDVTALLCHIYNLEIEAIHSTMPLLFERDTPESVDSLRKVLFGIENSIIAPSSVLNRHGSASGRVVGGNLSILNNLIGSPSDIDTTNTILFIEDLDEYLYHIDRMMVHLKRAGKLDNLAGLIIGHMSDMKDNTIPFGSDAYEIIYSWIKDYNFPVAFGFPIGHQPMNLAFPHGRIGKLNVGKEGSSLTFN